MSLEVKLTDLATRIAAEVKSKPSTSEAMVVVEHGADDSVARPAGAASVYWVGTADPVNATENDLWMDGLGNGLGNEGPQGPPGPAGADGNDGAAATITGATATGLAAGANPTVTPGGTPTARSFAFGIPAGAKGATGDTGPVSTAQGPKGDDGDKGDTGPMPTLAGNNRVWTNNGSGNLTAVAFGTAASANAIVQRIAGGQITVPATPSANTNSASKQYVDAEVAKKSTVLVLGASDPVPSGTPVGTIIVRTP